MTALVLVFDDGDGGFDVLPYCWLPGATLQEREDEDHMPYRVWAQQGDLLTFPGCRSTDPRAVAAKIAELHGQYGIKALAFDRWRIADLERELSAIGCNVALTSFGQGFNDMAPAVDVLERLVEEGKLRHGGHPVLAMAAANAKAEVDAAGNRKLSKRKSTGRIDPLVALTMALGIAARPVSLRCRCNDRVSRMSAWPYNTQRWQRLRKLKLQVNPLCEVCLNEGRITSAVAVDHIVPVSKGGDPYPPLHHMDLCCSPCHNRKTRFEQQNKPLTAKGCDVFGNPLDPNHDWYKQRRK